MAGKKSTVATHPRRAEIEAQIRRGVPAAHVARDFNLSRQAVSRAKSKLMKRPAGEGSTERDEMRRRIQGLYNSVLSLVQVAHEENNPRKFLAAVSEARKCLGLLSKIIGVLDAAPPPAVNVSVQVDIIELRAVMVGALAPFPEAGAAVAQALLEYDERGAEVSA